MLTLTNRLEGSPEVPLAIARLYFARVDHGCDYRPAREVLADLLMVSVFGDAGLGETGYWQHCVSRDTEEALEVVRTALAGEMPAWLADTYGDENGDLDLALVWSHIKAEGDPSAIMRDLMRTAFGGLCRSDALWNSAIRIPWRDGGCVPQAPAGLAAVAAVDGIMAVSWQAPDDDGGSRITGYTVQWKSGAQDYDASRETSVTDLADLSHTIEGLSHGVDYTIRILASNINGDGAASEVTTTAVGSEAALETLALAGATLYPTFSSTTSSYAAVTGHAATQITIAATAADADASVAFLDVDGNALTDAGTAAEFQVNLSVGANVIQVRVTAQDGVTATYTVTVTRAAENTSLSPPASDPVAASPSSARYTITFKGNWTTEVTPDGVPSGAHFSPLIGGVHGAGVTFLVRGGAASAGIESMAEVGQTSQLRSEVNAAINASPATALAVLSRSGNIGPTASKTLSNVTLTTDHPRVTLLTMIAPSHDWFVGVSGMPLLNEQGEWLGWVRVFLYPWDAGSEEGDDFSLSPSVDTSPRGVIHSIRGTGKFTTKRIATLTFTRISVSPSFPATESGARTVAENTARGEDIGAPVAATDPEGGSVRYSLGGPDAASFAIDTSSGQLRTQAALDHEARSEYAVTVIATDTSNLTTEIEVTITVTNVDEGGTVTLFPAQPRVSTVLRATLSDPDGGLRSVSWRWQRSTDETTWTRLSGSSASYTPTSGDQGMYLRAIASYTDGEASGKSASAASDQMVGAREAAPGITVVELVSGLNIPWDLAFTPDGTMLFTQRSGVLSARLTDGTVQTVTADFSDRYVSGETGLMAIVVDPGFASNRRFYTCQGHTGPEVQVIAWTINATYTTATRVADPLVGGMPAAGRHGGCRLRFGPSGYLWIATGDAASGTVPQNLSSLGGKVLRVNASTGAAAPGNPLQTRVYTYGHRNPQGLARRPGTNQMWSVEHGPSIDDEINLLVKGGNYGWDPVPGYNESVPMTDLERFPAAVEAKWSSGDPTLATSGGIFLAGRDWKEWDGRLAVATLRGRSLRIFRFTSSGAFVSQVVVPELDGTFGRLRTPMLGPDGALYLTTSNGSSDRILKVVPSLPPAFPAATDTQPVDENLSASTIVATVTAMDPEGQALTYTLTGPDAADFNLVSASQGRLRANAPLDHEARSSYEVIVTAADPYGLSDSVTLTIEVADVNEASVVSGPPSVDFAENATSAIAEYTAADPEGASTTFTWSLSGADRGDFAISAAGVLTFNDPPDYEGPADSGGNNVYNVTVLATDDGTPAKTGRLNVTVTVTDVNDAPTVSGDDTLAYPENTATTRVLERYTATDPERRPITWSVSGADADAFRIDASGNLSFDRTPDYEAPTDSGGNNVYAIQVVATDDGNLSDGTPSQLGAMSAAFDVTVTVTRVNEPPEISGSTTINDYLENRTGAVAAYTARDPDGATTTFTWSLSGADRGDFEISAAGVLTFRDPPDYERPADSGRNNVYNVQVRASDGSLTGTLDVTVHVHDVNEAPTITGDQALSFPENSARPVATFSADDPEEEAFSWSVSGADSDDFEISEAGVLTFVDIPDFENPADADQDNDYLVTVEAQDANSNTSTLDVTVTVTNSTGTEEPTITTTTDPSPYRENGTGAVRTFRARDPQGRPITWRVTGTDSQAFEISSSGVLTFRSPPDFENPTDFDQDNRYEIRVVVIDDQNLTDSVVVTVTVTNDAEGVEPTISTRRPPSTYRENGASTVYTFRASDPQGSPITWSHTGTDADDFTITRDGSGRGLLTFDNPPDFENPTDADRDNEYELSVTAEDEDGHRDRLFFTISITDVNEGPEVSGPQSLSFPENQTTARILASYTATDPEDPAGTNIRWGLSGTDGGDFTISESGELSFKNVPDYDKPADSGKDNSYTFSVRASDGRHYGYFPVTVTVSDVNEAPAITTTSTSATELRQDENRTSRLYTYRATDPEGSTIVWTVGGVDGRFFAIDERGQFAFSASTPPDFEQPGDAGGDNVYEVAIEAGDGLNTGSLAVTVTVRAVDEGPAVSGPQSLSFPENQTTARILASYTATDPEDPAATITRWSLSGTDGGDFTISETGALSFKNVPDYDKPADSGKDNSYTFSVRASDGRHYGYFPVTVTVEDVNEPPTITTTSSSATALRQDENRTSRLYTYRATDPEGSTIVWTVGGVDGRFFAIDERGQFAFSASTPPDFEQPGDAGGNNVYEVAIQASDG